MALLGGDKNSPKTSSQSSSTTKNTQIGAPITTGANSTVGGAVTLSDLSNVGKVSITTTDQGAVSAGLNLGLKALDTANSENQAFLSSVAGQSQQNAQIAQSALNSAIGVASDVSNGQQNTSLRYIIYGIVGLGAVAAAYAYFSSRR